MAEDSMPVVMGLRTGEEPGSDWLREAVRSVVQELMEAEIQVQVDAGRYERTAERATDRNGYRRRPWDTRPGTVELATPKRRTGSYVPRCLEPRRRAEQALVRVIAEAYVRAVSTLTAETLVQSLGIEGLSKSEVSRFCAVLDEQVTDSRTRRLDAACPYRRLDARDEHVREDGRVQSMAALSAGDGVAHGVRSDGVRDVLGVDVGLSEDVALWRALLHDLVGRGVHGVRLVISDAHPGLKQAIAAVVVGASWQRCRVHVLRNVLARVAQRTQPMVAATVWSFSNPTGSPHRSNCAR